MFGAMVGCYVGNMFLQRVILTKMGWKRGGEGNGGFKCDSEMWIVVAVLPRHILELKQALS